PHPMLPRAAVPRPRLELACDLPAVRQHRRDDGTGREPGQPHLEPVPMGACAAQQLEAPANGVDGDVDPAVVVEVADGEAAPDDTRKVPDANECAPVHELTRLALCRAILEHLDRLGVPGEVRDRNGPVREDEVEIRVETEVWPCGPPAGEGMPEGGREACPHIRAASARRP